MSVTKKRKVHSPEFKAKVGLEALKSVKTINEIGQEFGVHPAQVGQWKKAIQEQAAQLFEGKRGPKPVAEHREPERLYGEIGRLKIELDLLVPTLCVGMQSRRSAPRSCAAGCPLHCMPQIGQRIRDAAHHPSVFRKNRQPWDKRVMLPQRPWAGPESTAAQSAGGSRPRALLPTEINR